MKYIIILTALALTACGDKIPAESVAVINPAGYQVERLFEVDGCRVYRFRDQSYTRYFTNCSGTTEWQEGCGKGCTRPAGVSGGMPR